MKNFVYNEQRKAEILQILRRLSTIEWHPGRVTPSTLTTHAKILTRAEVDFYYGDLDNALRAAGIWPNHPTAEELVKTLLEFEATHHHTPTLMDTRECRLPYASTMYQKVLDKNWSTIILKVFARSNRPWSCQPYSHYNKIEQTPLPAAETAIA